MFNMVTFKHPDTAYKHGFTLPQTPYMAPFCSLSLLPPNLAISPFWVVTPRIL